MFDVHSMHMLHIVRVMESVFPVPYCYSQNFTESIWAASQYCAPDTKNRFPVRSPFIGRQMGETTPSFLIGLPTGSDVFSKVYDIAIVRTHIL